MENNNIYDRYSRVLEDSFFASRDAREKARQKSLALAEKTANDNLSQEYIRAEQSKKLLPQQAAIMGIGGASETAAMAIESSYGKSRNNIYSSKQNAINDINIEADREEASENQAYQQALFEWEQERQSAARERERYQNEMSFKREQLEYQKQQDEYERSYQREKDKYAREQDTYTREYNQKKDAYQREQDAYARRQKSLQAARKTLQAPAKKQPVFTLYPQPLPKLF